MKNLLLLHGAIGAKDQLQTLATALSSTHKVHLLNFSGHGGEEIGDEFSIEAFANEVLQWLAENGIERISIFGYSMGGYVAIYLAANHPERIESIITLGTKYEWNETIAAKEAGMLNPEIIQQKVPKFAAQLEQRHHPNDWKTLLQQTADMLLGMGKNPPVSPTHFSTITAPVLLLLGDRDKMVTMEETISVYRQLPTAQLSILPSTQHPIEAVDVEVLHYLLKRFLQ